MQISIDNLSQMITRTGSGLGTRQKSGVNLEDSPRFIKAIEEAMIDAEAHQLITDKNHETTIEENDTAPADNKKPENDEDVDESTLAGVMGNQNPVVFILERDKESATTPEISAEDVVNRTDAVIEPDADVIKTDIKHLSAATQDVEATVAMPAAEAVNATETAIGEENTGAGAVNTKPDPVAENSETAAATDGTIGEETARMPVKRTSEKEKNEDTSSEFSKEGNLSPLENKNDAGPIKGRKEKTFSETIKVVAETVDNASVPLAEGIKPEQFRANQQMKQASLDMPVKTENLFDEMVSRIETMKTENQTTMSIQLKPEFLGKVALEIAMDTAGLHVKINAADSEVRTMINGQVNALIESLENKGIEVVEVEVVYAGVDNGAFKESRGGQAHSNHPQRSYRRMESVDGAAYYSALPYEMLDYYLDTDVSSVEYRA